MAFSFGQNGSRGRSSEPYVVFDYDGTLTSCSSAAIIQGLGGKTSQFYQSASLPTEPDVGFYFQRLIKQFGVSGSGALTRDYVKTVGEKSHFFNGAPEFISKISNSCHVDVLTCGFSDVVRSSAVFPSVHRAVGTEVSYNPETEIVNRVETLVTPAMKGALLQELITTTGGFLTYVGDGLTDVPAFRVAKKSGGIAVAVFDPADAKGRCVAWNLLRQKIVNRVFPANYTAHSTLTDFIEHLVEARQDSKYINS